MLVTAGEAYAELVGHVRFGVAIDAPAPLTPFSGIGWACAAVAAGAWRAAGNDALGRTKRRRAAQPARCEGRGAEGRRCVNARRDQIIERLRRYERPSAIRLHVARGRTINLLPVFRAPRQRDRAEQAEIHRIGEVGIEVALLLAQRAELEAQLRTRAISRVQRLVHRQG